MRIDDPVAIYELLITTAGAGRVLLMVQKSQGQPWMYKTISYLSAGAGFQPSTVVGRRLPNLCRMVETRSRHRARHGIADSFVASPWTNIHSLQSEFWAKEVEVRRFTMIWPSILWGLLSLKLELPRWSFTQPTLSACCIFLLPKSRQGGKENSARARCWAPGAIWRTGLNEPHESFSWWGFPPGSDRHMDHIEYRWHLHWREAETAYHMQESRHVKREKETIDNKRMNERINGWINACTDRQTDRQTDR